MNIAILYVCTGKYDVFWKTFYRSAEAFFLPGYRKEYFVFTDAEELYDEAVNPSIHKIFQERMGWPYDTLLRFKLFASIGETLKNFDYIFFFNANSEIVKPILPEDFLRVNKNR